MFAAGQQTGAGLVVANRYTVGGSHCGGVRASVLAFGFIGLSGFVPSLAMLWLLSISLGMNNLLAEVAANQGAITWNFLLLANSDLVARIALLGLLVAHAHLNVLAATAITLIATFGARFVVTGRFTCLARPGRRSGTVPEALVAEV